MSALACCQCWSGSAWTLASSAIGVLLFHATHGFVVGTFRRVAFQS